MPRVEFYPSGKSAFIDESTLISDAAGKAGVHLHLPCGGKGTCKRCLVLVISGDVVKFEHPPEDVPSTYALACKTAVGQSDCCIEVQECDYGQYDVEEAEVISQKHFVYELKPLVQSFFIKIPTPQLDDGLSDAERIERELKKLTNTSEIIWPLPILRLIPHTLRADNGNLTVLCYKDKKKLQVCGITSGKLQQHIFGIAVDLGTTTVSVALVDLVTGSIVGIASGYNDQIICGEDIISRIYYAHNKERLYELHSKAIFTINRLINRLTTRANILPDDIYAIVVSGNPTMMHFFLCVNPEYLRVEPYSPVFFSYDIIYAKEIGLLTNPQAVVYLSPAVGNYVGGDITAGILCTDLYEKDELSLFIDVGTNGEIVLGNREFLFACACSAGPAFEGGGISCGIRAINGAINDIEIDKEGNIILSVIGNGEPIGICGSGIVNIISKFLQNGIIDRSGKFVEGWADNLIEREGRRVRFKFPSLAEKSSRSSLFLTDHDIENVMRAKAAVFSAITTLLEFTGLTLEQIAHVYVAGGFGRFLNVENAITIGLLPELPHEKFEYLGNASLEGSIKLLLSESNRILQNEIASRMTYINLSTQNNYHSHYTASLFFPHTDERLFPSSIKKIQCKQ